MSTLQTTIQLMISNHITLNALCKCAHFSVKSRIHAATAPGRRGNMHLREVSPVITRPEDWKDLRHTRVFRGQGVQWIVAAFVAFVVDPVRMFETGIRYMYIYFL